MAVAILGAGISGLVVARALREKGIDFDLLEAQDQPGGLCRSDTLDGYVMDRAGGHIIFSRHEKAMDYYHSVFADEPLVRNERHTKILFKGRYIRYPFENGIGQLTPADRLTCLRGFLDAALARSDGTPKPDNFRDWIRYHVGSGIADLFMDPYNQKIWELSDLGEMGISWVDGRVPEAPIGDIVKAALGQRTLGYTHQAIFFYPRRNGFQDLTDRIARFVEDRLHTSTPVTDISREGRRYRVNGKLYDSVISTLPMPVLADLVEGLDSATREAARGLGYISLACFLFGIAAEDVQPLSWVYLPHPDQGPANRVTYLSNYSPGNAPEGRGSLLAEVTYRGTSPASDPSFAADLRRHLAGQGLFREENVSVQAHRDSRFAYIHFGLDFEQRRAQAISGLEQFGILPLGRFGRYNYYNTDLCILEALEMADRVATQLGVEA